MTARSGMSNLITRLRMLANAGTADYTTAGQTFWSDDQLEDVLDTNRVDFTRELLNMTQDYSGGSVIYKRYSCRFANLEEGTDAFEVQNAAGSAIGTALYTPDYLRGVITFASDTGGSSYYLNGRSYNLNRSAAQVWRMKASYHMSAYDVSTDNHSLKRSQLYEHCVSMAESFDAQAGALSVDGYRSDTDAF